MVGKIVHAVSIILSVFFALAAGDAFARNDFPLLINVGSTLIVFVLVALLFCVMGNDTDK